jgi:soluble lytic murein transglycosylase
MAWVYGLIRQESRFIHNVRSHVGASGLMQLMPKTAQFVARKIGLTGYAHDQVTDIDTNILLGASYLSMVLTDLDGSEALATAAYNAGPSRSRAWRATLPQAVEGAIFAETIPFSETRDYVKKVLSNATYYAALFDGTPQSLKARLGTVAPRAMTAGDLP